MLVDSELGKMLSLMKDADSVELKLTVPESNQLSAGATLGMDPLNAQIREVFFFDPRSDSQRAGRRRPCSTGPTQGRRCCCQTAPGPPEGVADTPPKIAELWNYPDNSRILELSTRCAPADALRVAVESQAFLRDRGVDLSGEQQTKTKTALEFFSKSFAASA